MLSLLQHSFCVFSSLAFAVHSRTFDRSNITLAAVVAAPAGWPLPVTEKNWDHGYFDLNSTIAYATRLIKEARNEGADLIVFPEVWFPGYPKSYEEKRRFPKVESYIDESMVVGSPQWQTLVSAAADASMYLSFGYSERSGDLIYMSQALIGPTGGILINRRKLRPSGDERGLWSDGDANDFVVVNTDIGRIGMLMCWEHLNPAMYFPMKAQLENIHIGPWPYNANRGSQVQDWEDAEVSLSAQRLYSMTTGSVVVAPAVGYGFINTGVTVLVDSDSTAIPSAGDLSTDRAIIYASVDGSSWRSQLYNINGQYSWGILTELEKNYPEFIPRENGSFVDFTTFSTSEIIRELSPCNSTNTTCSATGTPSKQAPVSSPTEFVSVSDQLRASRTLLIVAVGTLAYVTSTFSSH